MSDSVLVVDDRRDVLELNRILLAAEGYDTDGCTYAEATPERLRQSVPRVVLLDLIPGDTAPWDLLHRLRHDEALRAIGVVVTSDVPTTVERALADKSLGVAAGLVMPFDIEALYTAIAAAARQDGKSVPAATATPLLERAAAVIRQGRQRILMRWVQRLSAFDVFRDHPDLSLQDMRGQGEALLDGVADALALQAATLAVPSAAAGISIDAARAHARLRRAQGLNAANVAREMAALRREVWREVRSDIMRDPPPLDDVWSLQSRFFLSLDESLFVMLDMLDETGAP